MTLTIDDVADYLASGGVGTVGTDIYESGFFDGGTPPAPDVQVAIFEYPGDAPAQVLGPANASPILYPRVQVMCRAATYAAARAKAQAVYDRLSGVVGVTINGTRYLRIEAIGEPGFVGSDENSRPLIATNFKVTRAP